MSKVFKKRLTCLVLLLSLLSLFTINFMLMPVMASGETIDPLVWYEFADSLNLGKDTMGNYDLQSYGTVTQNSYGAAFSEGKLSVSNEDNDISEKLTNFSLAFEITPQSNTEWSMPIGFSWNDWTATKFCWFTVNNGYDLRFCTHDTDTSNDGYWGPMVAQMQEGTTYKILLSAQLGGKITIFVDGVKSDFEYDLPENWNLNDTNMRFAIGGATVWDDTVRNPYNGSIGNVKIYPFAMTQNEVTAYNTNDVLTADDVTVMVTAGNVDMSGQVQVEAGSTTEQILAVAPNSSLIDVTMSDETTRKATVKWDNVITQDNETYLEGNITDVINPAGIKARAKISVLQNVVEIKPVVKFDFVNNTESEIGKDIEGNFDLTAYNVTKTQNGAKIADGLLYATADNDGKDFSDYLNNATISLKFTVDQLSSNAWWCIFSIDDYYAHSTKQGLNLFVQDGNLRMCATGSDWWEQDIVKLVAGSEYQVDMVVDASNNQLFAYVNNTLKRTVALPEDYTLSAAGSQSTFTLGGANQDGGKQTDNSGIITFSQVMVYSFAMTADQINALNNTGIIKSNNLASSAYLSEVGFIVSFEGEKISESELYNNMTKEEMLSKINNATVSGTLSDSSIVDVPVVWTDIDMDTFVLEGYVNTLGLGVAVATDNCISVSEQLTVSLSYAITIASGIENGNVTASSTYGLTDDIIVITPTPNNHYKIDSILVNGTEIQPVNGVYSYKITNSDIEISATFENVIYKVTIGEISNGSIDLSSSEGIVGTEIVITAIPNEHYTLTKIFVNGVQILPENKVYKVVLSQDVKVTAEFAQAVYNVDLIVGNNGSATADKVSGKNGETVTLTLTSEEGYKVKQVKVNGEVIEPVEGIYSFEIDGDSAVEVSFEKITYALIVDSEITGGTITVSKPNAAKGETIIISVNAQKGYTVSKVYINGEEIQAVDGIYTFVVDGEAIIDAEFTKNKGCSNSIGLLGAIMLLVCFAYLNKKTI